MISERKVFLLPWREVEPRVQNRSHPKFCKTEHIFSARRFQEEETILVSKRRHSNKVANLSEGDRE
jgi:hypothetical protein